MSQAATGDASRRFRDTEVTLANGVTGEHIDVPSASPSNYHQAIGNPAAMPRLTIDAKLFMPPAPAAARTGKLALVMVVPGSLGVAASHLAHAEAMTRLGAAALVVDGFGARDVVSTVANQTQFSFAASAYDVLAALKVARGLPGIDPDRIGAQGHSRGGSAVLMAATRRLADAVVGPGIGLRAVYAAYPWCGQQFVSPSVGATEVGAIIGDADEWCSPMQVQGHMQAIRLSGGTASLRIVGGAQHSFDRGAPIVDVAAASVAPAAPTAYLADDGAFIHPLRDEPDPALMDRDLMVYGLKAGFGRKGAKIGGRAGDAELFRIDMIAFWRRALALA